MRTNMANFDEDILCYGKHEDLSEDCFDDEGNLLHRYYEFDFILDQLYILSAEDLEEYKEMINDCLEKKYYKDLRKHIGHLKKYCREEKKLMLQIIADANDRLEELDEIKAYEDEILSQISGEKPVRK